MDRKYQMSFFRVTVTALLAVSFGILAGCGGGGGGSGPAGPTAPSAFDLLDPADGASNVALVPSLSWVDAAGETSYTLQISTDPAFTSPLMFERTDLAENTTSFTVPAGVLGINTTYYWRLLAVNAQGSTESAPFSFTTKNTSPDPFQMATPADMTQDVSLTPTLTWTDAIGASHYTVELSTDAGFAGSTVSLVTPTNTSFAVPAPLQEWTTHYWRVAAVNSAGTTTAANAPFSFKTRKNGAPDAFDLTAPANNAVGASLTPDLTWTAAFGVTTYTVQIASDAAFTAVLLTEPNIPATAGLFRVPSGVLTETTTYYWRVLAVNPSGSTSANATFNFTTMRITAPAAFTLLSPSNAATGALFPVTLSWSNAVGEDSYTVQISTDNFASALYVYENTAIPADSTNHTVASGILAAGTTYSWRVIAVNSIGSTTANNAPFSFTTKNSGELVWARTGNPSTIQDQPFAMASDGNYLYIAGYDSNTLPGDDQWHIEKRKKTDGTLDTLFGGGSGSVVSNPSGATINSSDVAYALAIDATYMYVVGYDSSAGDTDDGWHIEKRYLSDGSLVTSFPTGTGGGMISENNSVGSGLSDQAYAIAVDATYMYIVGYEDVSGMGLEWRIEKRDKTSGALVASVTSGISTANDVANAIAIDSTYLYVVGTDSSFVNAGWRIEKRKLADLSLETTTFGGGAGFISFNPSSGTDAPMAIAIDASSLYVWGYYFDSGASNKRRWRVDKIALSDGAPAFGFGVSGVVQPDNENTNAAINTIAIDGTSLYLGGYDNVPGNIEWRMEKRNLSDGSLVTSFRTNGVIKQDYPAMSGAKEDSVRALIVDADYLYAAGFDDSLGLNLGYDNYQWRIEKLVK